MDVKNIRIEEHDTKSILLADVTDIRGRHTLYLAVENENRKYLDDKNGDTFLLVCLLPAMLLGENLRVEAPVSAQLFYHLQTQLIPWWLKVNPKLNPIQIILAHGFSKKMLPGKAVGTGVSCGIDSFYTILSHLEDKIPAEKKLTHLLLIQRQAETHYHEDLIFEIPEKDKQRLSMGEQLHLDTMYVWNNFALFMDFPFEQICTYHDVGTAMALKKLFQTYYYASSYSLEDFHLTFEAAPLYDILNTCSLQTETFQMISHPLLVERVEKTEWLAHFPIVQENLNVCFHENHKFETVNCSECEKCVRTMTTLDAQGTLAHFSKTFRLDHYLKNKNRFIGNTLYRSWINHNPYDKAIIKSFKEKKIRFSKKAYFWFLYTGIHNQWDKLRHKVKFEEQPIQPISQEALEKKGSH